MKNDLLLLIAFGTKTNDLRATGTLSQLKLTVYITVYITIITVINNYNSHKVVKLTRGGKE